MRILDIADPTRPREVGYFIPPRADPQAAAANGRGPRPFVWSVYPRGDLILASDEQTGLYILRDVTR